MNVAHYHLLECPFHKRHRYPDQNEHKQPDAHRILHVRPVQGRAVAAVPVAAADTVHAAAALGLVFVLLHVVQLPGRRPACLTSGGGPAV